MTLEVASQVVCRLRVNEVDTQTEAVKLINSALESILVEVTRHASLRLREEYDIDIIVNISPSKGLA